MQGLLDTAEREFRVAGWKTSAAPTPDKPGRQLKNPSSALIAPQINGDVNAGGSRRQSAVSKQDRDAHETSPERTPALQSPRDATGDTKVPFFPNGASNGDALAAKGVGGEPTIASGSKKIAGGREKQASRKRQRVHSDGSVIRASPSPPKRPGEGDACPRAGDLSSCSNEDDPESLPLHESSGTGEEGES